MQISPTLFSPTSLPFSSSMNISFVGNTFPIEPTLLFSAGKQLMHENEVVSVNPYPSKIAILNLSSNCFCTVLVNICPPHIIAFNGIV